MSERPQRRTLLLFSVLSVYVVLQFTWWAVLLLRKDRAAQELAIQVQALGGTPAGLVDPARSARMVMGEAAVVLLILLAILWLTFRALRRDLGVARTQRNFLLAVTHELRSPIAAIKLQLQTLARPGLTTEQQATLRNTALSEAERLTGLTDKVLMATKADDGLMPLDPAPLDVVQVVSAVVERARSGPARSHTVHLHAPAQLPLTMDQHALHSIADNLVENAAKYAPAGTDITVQVEALKDQWRLSVSDQGPGIPLAERSRIFEKFYRAGNEETRSAKGTGLGLYIVQRLVQRSGGVITVRCGAQQGTTFAATFPLRSPMTTNKVALVVLDGWGIGAGDATDAVAQAHTPFMDELLRTRPHATLLTDGENVGLPAGQMGNSEVGHMNIGAGRVVFQDLVRIDRAIRDGSLAQEPALTEAFQAARRPGARLHLMGLLSDGGVHAMRHHAEALCKLAVEAGVPEVFVHAFTDGRDADPKSGKGYMQRFLANVAGMPVRIATVVGRYYAMDRDKRWERVARAYDLLVRGNGVAVNDPLEPFDRSYAAGTTDEFVEPYVVCDDAGAPIATIRPGDVVICFNYRTDRCREITQMLTQSTFTEQGTTPLDLHYVTMTDYDPTFRKVDVIFRKDDLAMTLGEVVANAGLRQIRIAETEKYPHVSFFFSGGREAPFTGEQRLMVPSPKVATYDLQPEMSAQGIVDSIVPELRKGAADLVVLNFANPDMVGHTGVFAAVVKAVETTDQCLAQLVQAGLEQDYRFVIIADHGNADKALNPDGSPNTAHSTNPVPVVVIAPDVTALHSGILADVAPTVLDLMNVKKPAEMTGSSLLVR